MNAVRTPEEYEALLREVAVNFDTGKVTWVTRKRGRPSKGAAGCSKPNGYIYIRHSGKEFLAHRVVYFAANGSLPPSIDHVDRDPANNALSNLRAASQSENNINRGMMRSNKSGVTGVMRLGVNGKWRAFIKRDGKARMLGDFVEKADAILARMNAETSMREAAQ